jgi:hypothetical protein
MVSMKVAFAADCLVFLGMVRADHTVRAGGGHCMSREPWTFLCSGGISSSPSGQA